MIEERNVFDNPDSKTETSEVIIPEQGRRLAVPVSMELHCGSCAGLMTIVNVGGSDFVTCEYCRG